MLPVERFPVPEDTRLSDEEVKGISEAFDSSDEKLKEDLKECSRKQSLSTWYAMQLPPDGV